jgi:hypothetical protein
VLGDRVLPLADLFLAAGMIAKYTAPGLTKWLLTRILTSGETPATAVVAPQRQRLHRPSDRWTDASVARVRLHMK